MFKILKTLNGLATKQYKILDVFPDVSDRELKRSKEPEDADDPEVGEIGRDPEKEEPEDPISNTA